MATEAIYKLQPHRTMYLRGFDRRGSAASLNNASSTGCKVSGHWSDIADFAVLMLHDSDDGFGHLETTRYLPSTNMTGVVLDVDVALSGCFSPTSIKYDSLAAAQLSYITGAETPGSKPLASCMTSTSGGSCASQTFTIGGTIVSGDLFYIIYLGNYQAFYQATSTSTPTSVASGLTISINTGMMVGGLSIAPYAVWNGSTGLTVYAGRSAPSSLFTLSGTAFTLNTGVMTAAQAAITGFWGVSVGDTLMFTDGANIEHHTVSAVVSPWHITLDSAVTITPSYAAWPLYQADGNSVQFWVGKQSTAGTISPSGAVKLAGGSTETSLHLKIDFSALGLTSLRQAWLTLGPLLNLDTAADNQTVQPFVGCDFLAQYSNWTVTDPSGNTYLQIAGPGSVVVGSRDSWSKYSGSGWTEQPNGSGSYVLSGNYYHGFSHVSATAGDSVTVTYSCQYAHDVYLGTAAYLSSGTLHASVDGVAQPDVDCYADASTPIQARRLVKSSVPAGAHTVTLTVSSAKNSASLGYNCVFDFLQAAVRSDVQDAPTTYSTVNVAMDYDTNQTYSLAPARSLWMLNRLGFAGDIDFYAGVFFALKRVRSGGTFHSATVTVGGTLTVGDACFINVAGTAFGAGVTAIDTLTSIAQRFVNAINATFVGVWAAPTSTAGQFTITVQSPINGFTLTVTPGTSVTISKTGDIGFGSSTSVGGNEGTWQVDPTQGSPFNRAFFDFFVDFCAIVKSNGWTATCAFSQELLGPPDSNDASPASVTFGFFNSYGAGYSHQITIGANTYTHVQLSTDGSGDIAIALAALINAGSGDQNAVATVSANNVALAPRGTGQVACTATDGNGPGTLKAGAWIQRYSNGATVLTSTGFGSWGAGVVEANASGTIQQTGHGYTTGNLIHLASGTGSGVWQVTVTDFNHYQLTTQVSNSGSYTPAAGDSAFAALQTAQCSFNASAVTPYMQACYMQAAMIMNAAGLVPWLQLGEILHWFFSQYMTMPVTNIQNTTPVKVTTGVNHNLSTGQTVVLAGCQGSLAVNGRQAVTVTSPTQFTINGSTGAGTWTGGGTVSGGGMAFYDASQAAAATTALGRALASFWTQDDDPTINSSADANFLAGRLQTHCSSIVTATKTAYSNAKFELLWPYDVNYKLCYFTNDMPWPQGGRLNRAVNMPSAWSTQAGSGLDRIKTEGLSWSATYHNTDKAKETVQFPYTVLSWSQSATRYLIPWFNGGCHWTQEYLYCLSQSTPAINFWAFDHATLFSWLTQPLPSPRKRITSR